MILRIIVILLLSPLAVFASDSCQTILDSSSFFNTASEFNSHIGFNHFDSPSEFRSVLLESIPIAFDPHLFRDLDVYIFPTKYCPVGCNHCYFGSPPASRKIKSKDPFVLNSSAISNFIDLLDSVGSRNLVITGGGDPLLEVANTAAIIGSAKARAITVHTSGFWASSEQRTQNTLDRLYSAFAKNQKASELNLRISVDRFHSKVPIENIQKIFAYFQKAEPIQKNFNLKIHSLDGDSTLDEIIDKVANQNFEITRNQQKQIIQINFMSGLKIDVDYSPLMPAKPNPDMRNKDIVQQSVDSFNLGRVDTPAIRTNAEGEKKACMCVYEDGDIELWNSGPFDNIPNIYQSSKKDIAFQKKKPG